MICLLAIFSIYLSVSVMHNYLISTAALIFFSNSYARIARIIFTVTQATSMTSSPDDGAEACVNYSEVRSSIMSEMSVRL